MKQKSKCERPKGVRNHAQKSIRKHKRNIQPQ